MASILRIQNICKKFPTGKGVFLEVLKDVSLSVDEGEIVAVVGPSGAGKSTLLHILGMLDVPDEGEIFFQEKRIASINDADIAHLRNTHIGFIFQFHHLLPEFTALENISMPALIAGNTISAASVRALELLDDIGLRDRASHKPNELSGGEQQRVAAARALMNNPSLILADEPSGNLDTENAASLHSMIFALREKYRKTFIIVTHNKEFASMADRVITMIDGRIVDTINN